METDATPNESETVGKPKEDSNEATGEVVNEEVKADAEPASRVEPQEEKQGHDEAKEASPPEAEVAVKVEAKEEQEPTPVDDQN